MDGLNCNEIIYSELFPDNLIFRLDSEFFGKDVISINRKISELPCFYLKNNEVVSGPFGSSLKSEAYMKEGDVPFVRIENIRGGFDINMDNIVYISYFDNNRIKNSQLQTDDIILSKVGNSIGFFARVDDSIAFCNISENNIGIKLTEYPTAKKHFILTYLNCMYAQKLVLRRTSGNAQPKLNVGDLCYISIPEFTNIFYNKISSIILNSKSSILLSKQKYTEAEQVFAQNIGFINHHNEIPCSSTKTFKKSFVESGRLDAEYYNPKYDMLFETLRKIKTISLGGNKGLVDIKKSIEPGSESYQDEGIPFIRVSDIDKFEISNPDIKVAKDIVSDVELLYPQKDTILLSKDGSVGIAHKVQNDMEAITSGAILHLIIKDASVILSDYLTLVLNSPVVQLQAERDMNGAIIQHWKPSDIEKVIIPLLDMNLQKDISNKVQESFRLRQESKHLLELAVKPVEIAIETNEDTALKWLDKQMQR